MFCRKNYQRQNNKGFTLMEVIIAISILAVVATASVVSITQFIKSREIIEKKQAEMEAINTMFLFLERDLSYAVPRPLKAGEDNDLFAAMEVYSNNPRNRGELMQFTTAYPIPGTVAQKTQRVSWRLIRGDLYRVVWDFMDHLRESAQSDDEDNPYTTNQHMLTGVDSIDIEVFAGPGDESGKTFFNEGVIDDESRVEDLYGLPRLIQFEIELDDGKEYKRLFYLNSASRLIDEE